MDTVTTALDRPELSGLLSHWTLQPLALVVVVALAAGYTLGLRKIDAAWPLRRTITFAIGLLVLLWLTCGTPEVYADSLFWIWTSQTLALWLGVPILIMSGKPVQLAQAVSGPGGRVDAVLASPVIRVVSNPLVGPALVPVLSFVLFFGSIPALAIATPAFGWILQVVLVAIGAVMVIPLVGLDETVSSLAVAGSLAVGSFELVIDALPGIVLRLHSGLATSYFEHRVQHGWTPSAQHDQEVAGAILWCVAELIDLPFLALMFRRWLRADARDAERIDAVLAAERAARRGLDPESAAVEADVREPAEPDAERDEPWWLSDPAMVERLRRQR